MEWAGLPRLASPLLLCSTFVVVVVVAVVAGGVACHTVVDVAAAESSTKFAPKSHHKTTPLTTQARSKVFLVRLAVVETTRTRCNDVLLFVEPAV